MNKNMSTFKNQGFTLIELMIVVVIIGTLTAIIAPKLLGSTDKAKTTEKWVAAEQISQCVGVYNISLGLSSNNPTNVPNFLATGNTMLDVIMDGDVAVVSASKARFNAESLSCGGLKKMVDTVTAAIAGTSGSYTVSGNNLSIANGGAREIDIVFANTSTSEVQAMAFEYGNATAFDGATIGSSGPIRWDAAAAAGTNTLTIRLPKI